MSRRYAYILLGLVVAIFLIGIADITFVQDVGPITARITSLTGVIISGVAIGSILAGLRRNGNGNGNPRGHGRDPNDDPDDSHTDRSRQTARIEHQQEEGDL